MSSWVFRRVVDVRAGGRTSNLAYGEPTILIRCEIECEDTSAARELIRRMEQNRFPPASTSPLEVIVERTLRMYQSGASLEDAIKAAVTVGELKEEPPHDHLVDTYAKSLGPRGVTVSVTDPGPSLGPSFDINGFRVPRTSRF